jgi:uncharacterized protein YjbI with pentapeptide repeats
LHSAILLNTDLKGANLNHAGFQQAHLGGADFKDAELANATGLDDVKGMDSVKNFVR